MVRECVVFTSLLQAYICVYRARTVASAQAAAAAAAAAKEKKQPQQH
jgi:hypothetical protein